MKKMRNARTYARAADTARLRTEGLPVRTERMATPAEYILPAPDLEDITSFLNSAFTELMGMIRQDALGLPAQMVGVRDFRQAIGMLCEEKHGGVLRPVSTPAGVNGFEVAPAK